MSTLQVLMGIFLVFSGLIEAEYYDTKSAVFSVLRVIVLGVAGAAAIFNVIEPDTINYQFAALMGLCYTACPIVVHRLFKKFNRRAS